MQKTLILLKPDAVQRGLIGKLISRLERKGLRVVGIKMLKMDEMLARQHYSPHIGKPFFDGLIGFITSGPLVALVAESEHAVELVRSLIGSTDPQAAAPGTVRGDFAVSIGPNLIHGSDSVESAEREIELFFSREELVCYTRDIDKWITES